METRNPKVLLGVVLTAALVVRIAWGVMQPGEIDERLPDQREYLELAENLLSGRGLHFFDPRFQQEVYAFRTPGYPMFIAAVGGNVRVVRVAQAFLDVSTVLAVYLLARRWLEHWPSLMAAALIAFNPFLIYFSGLILTETLYTAMLAWAAVLLVWSRNPLWGGALMAVSVLVRPSAVVLPVVMGYAAVFVNRRRGESESRLKRWLRVPVGATMLLLTGLALLPWGMRNRAVLGEWVLLTTNGGVTRYDGFNPDATGSSDQRFLRSGEFAGLGQMTEVQRDQYLSARAGQWIAETRREEPRKLVWLTGIKLARTWSPVPLSEDFGSRTMYRLVAMAYSVPFYVLCLLGLWITSRRWRGAIPAAGKLLLIAPAVYFSIVHALTVGSLRYRVPVEPLLAVLAGAGAAALIALIGAPTWRRERVSDV